MGRGLTDRSRFPADRSPSFSPREDHPKAVPRVGV